MQALIRSKSAGITGGRGTAGAGPGRDLLYQALFPLPKEHTKRPKTGKTLLPMKRMVIPENPSSTLPLPRMVSLQNSWLNIKVRSTHTINKHYGEKHMSMKP